MAWVFGLSMFLSAALLFAIQPMMGKVALPKFGGGPAVWTTCMVFFQAALLAGYGYAHYTPRRLGLAGQRKLHIALLFLPLVVLPLGWLLWPFAAPPLGLHESWAPPASTFPAPFVLLVLLALIGLPFFVLSTSAPLLQRWFAATGRPGANDPYFLYAASNLGSLIALLGYPFLVERHLALTTQGWVWLAGYLAVAGLIAASMLLVPLAGASEVSQERERLAPAAEEVPDDGSDVPTAIRLDELVTARQRFFWVARAFVPSSLMLGMTTHFTTEIAPVPLLWVLPLAVYLISFIIAFSRLPVALFHFLMPGGVLVLAYLLASDTAIPVMALDFSLHLLILFIIATSLHGAVAADRPGTAHLTEYFLWIALGGVLGGGFNAWVAPLAFHGVAEYPIALALAALVLPPLTREAPCDWRALADVPLLVIVGVLGALLLLRGQGGNSVAVWLSAHRTGLIGGVLVIAGLVSVLVLLVKSDRGRRAADGLMPLAIALWALAAQASADATLGRMTLLALAATLVLTAGLDIWQRRWLRLAYLIWPLLAALQLSLALHLKQFDDRTLSELHDYGVPLALAAAALDRPLRFGLGVAAVFLVASLGYHIGTHNYTLHRERSFFGVSRVTMGEIDDIPVHKLVHGSTLHGMQAWSAEQRAEATTYYHARGPLGDLLRSLSPPLRQAPLAVIGLGAGTVACYGQPGQELVFFEIDPAMVRIARDPELFTFLADAEARGSTVRTVLGDGRVQLAQEPDGHFGVIVIDAFSSDAIPAHLITREAVQVYLKKLKPGGVLAFHISNRYLDLEPVLGNLAQDAGLAAWRRHDFFSDDLKNASEWVLLARRLDDLRGVLKWPGWEPVIVDSTQRPWTDDYNNLLDVYRWKHQQTAAWLKGFLKHWGW